MARRRTPLRLAGAAAALEGYAGTISEIEELDVAGTVDGDTLVFDPQSLLDRGSAG